MKKISSLQNTLIKQVKMLHDAKERRERGLFIAEGLRTIEGLLQGGIEFKNLFYTMQTAELAKQLSLQIMHKWPKTSFILVEEAIMYKISTLTTPAQILAVLAIPKIQLSKSNLTTGVVLAQVSDPGNMGSLIRTTAALGYQTVVVVEGTDPWSPKVVQASAGALGKVNIFKISWAELVAHKNNLKLCALVVKNGLEPHNLNLKDSLIVVGNEAQGLPEAWVEQCEQKMTIPMPGNTESLNAAIAGSIALYLSRFN